MNMFKAAQKGFTLIEIMIVIIIVGVLASIVMPNYVDYVKKGKSTEATATLADTRIKMEQCYQDERDYTDAACTALCTPAGTHFTFTCVAGDATATTYTLNAAGIGDVSNFNYTVNESNDKTSKYDGVDGATCWKTSKTSAC